MSGGRGGGGSGRGGGFRRDDHRNLTADHSKDGSNGDCGGEQDRDNHKETREDMGTKGGEEDLTTNTIRIYVGGLGEGVTSDDLCATFSKMGVEIEAVDIIRTKGRSFAYINLSHQSSNSLPKLFNTYNGCVWKGGKLRLEKAKEDYLARLKREWDEDAQSAINSSATDIDININNTEPAEKPKKGTTSEKKQLRLFFPKLRKVKSLPFTGTGKHKYSFRRVEVPPLSTYFCDCEEHCGSLYNFEEKRIPRVEDQGSGMDKHEIELMNSVMYKLFEKENDPLVECNDAEMVKEEVEPDEEINDLQLDENDGTDDDMIINVVSRGKETIRPHQDSESNKRQATNDGPSHKMPKKKTRYDGENSKAQSKEAADTSGATDSEPKSSNGHFSSSFSWSQKSSWKELIGDKSKNSISISDILPSTSCKKNKRQALTSDNSKTKKSPKDKHPRDHLDRKAEDAADAQKGGIDEIEKSLNEYQRDQLDEEVEDTAEAQPTKPDLPSEKHEHLSDQLDEKIEDAEEAEFRKPDSDLDKLDKNIEGSSNKTDTASEKVGRGSAWLNKSSWTQLVTNNTSTSFSITQIIPGLALDKQENAKPDFVAATTSSKDDSGDKVIEKGEVGSTFGDSGSANAAEPATSKPKTEVEPFFSRNFTGVETCSFKRSDESLKEFAKLRAALSRTRKKTDKKK